MSYNHINNPVVIAEQPLQRGYRFRYKCEGSSHGPLPGENSIRENKTYPTVIIRTSDMQVVSPILLMVSLVGNDGNQHPHSHTLIGKNVYSGHYLESLKPSASGSITHQVNGISILHTVTKKKFDVLACKRVQEELLNTQGVDNYFAYMRQNFKDQEEMNTEWYSIQHPNLYSKHFQNVGTIKVLNNVVCLKFTVFIKTAQSGVIYNPIELISKPVYDSKCAQTGVLAIRRLSIVSGSVKGGDEMFLICDKIDKAGIKVIFDDESGWKAEGEFKSPDVFHQVVIVLKTPPYKDLNLTHPVSVKLYLQRANEKSFHFTFSYKPVHHPYAPAMMDYSGTIPYDDFTAMGPSAFKHPDMFHHNFQPNQSGEIVSNMPNIATNMDIDNTQQAYYQNQGPQNNLDVQQLNTSYHSNTNFQPNFGNTQFTSEPNNTYYNQSQQHIMANIDMQNPQRLQNRQEMQNRQGLQNSQAMQNPQGLQNLQGMQNPQGIQNPQGMQDPQGMQNPQGMQYLQGMQNPQEMQNPQGLSNQNQGFYPLNQQSQYYRPGPDGPSNNYN